MKSYKVYQIIVAVIFAIVTILSSIMLADMIKTGKGVGTALTFIIWLILAIIGFAVPMIMSLIGTITCAVKRKQGLCDTKTLVYFIVFTALPLIVFFASILILNLAI